MSYVKCNARRMRGREGGSPVCVSIYACLCCSRGHSLKLTSSVLEPWLWACAKWMCVWPVASDESSTCTLALSLSHTHNSQMSYFEWLFEYKLILGVSTLATWAVSNTLVHSQSLIPFYAFDSTGCKAMLPLKFAWSPVLSRFGEAKFDFSPFWLLLGLFFIALICSLGVWSRKFYWLIASVIFFNSKTSLFRPVFCSN